MLGASGGLSLILAGMLVAGPARAEEAKAAAGAAPPLAPGAAPAAGPLPALAFARLPFFADGEISADGLSFAGKLVIGGTQLLGVRHLFDAAAKPLYLRLPETDELDWVRWVNKDFVIAGMRALLPLGGPEKAYVRRIMVVDLRSGKATILLRDLMGQNGGDLLWVARDGTPQILVAAQNSIYLDENFFPTVYRINLETGRRVVVQAARSGIYRWIADGNGVVRAGIGTADDGRSSRLLYRGSEPTSALVTIDRANSRANESVIVPIAFVPGGDHAVVDIVNDDVEGLYEMDMRTHQKVRTLYQAQRGIEIDRINVSEDQTTVLGIGLSSEPGKTRWLTPAMASLQEQFDKSVTGRNVDARIVSMNADRTSMLLVLDSPSTPGALYYFNVDSGSMQRIAVMNDTLRQRPMAPVRTVRYKARDGLEIEAVLTLPGDRPAHELPIVMFPHGGPWAHDAPGWDYMAQYMANLGYAVMQPNFRGSTGYGPTFLKRGEGQMGLAMQDDITDGLKWAAEQGIADARRACIVGASYGGYATMWGLAKDPDLYRCGVSISGVASLRREVNDFGNSLMSGKYTDDWKAMTPDFAAVSPLNAVARIKAPLMLIHGRKDVTVNVSHSDSMASRMRAAGKTVDYLSLPMADHYFTREADREAMLTGIGTWLKKYNP